MAGVAGQSSGVVGGGDLGEGLRLGAIGFVTAGTNDSGIEFGGLHRGGIIGVFGLGSVASLASNDYVLAKFLLIGDVAMAGLAGVVPGEGNRAGRDFVKSRAAIVAILPKAVGHYGSAQNHEREQRDHDHDREPKQVFDVFEQVCGPVGMPGWGQCT